ncbi:MAG TPA: SPOR domain-containing protein, partial [Saliniramus sp.]|nr:SPOR domain-containing protein [Saliniramus sp.]
PVPSAVPQVAGDPTPPAPVAQAPEPAPVPPAVPVQPQPAVPIASAPMALTGAPPVAPQREAQPESAPQAPTQVASLPDPAPQAAAPAPAATGGYAVQLAIRETEERAYQAFSQYQARYAGIIDNADPIVRRAELNGNTIYRIRVGPYALADANAVCERIKGTGGDCFVARN